VLTDTTGQATVDVTARVPGNDTITVSALGATATATLSISADNFVLTTSAPPTGAPLNIPQPVMVHWDKAGVNQGGQIINFFATRGNFATAAICPATVVPTVSATTVSIPGPTQGNTTVYICSDNAGPAVISAVANVSNGPSGQVSIEFVATNPASLVLQASPTTLGVNVSGGSTQQSVITAVVRDAKENLVKDKTVSFSLTDVSGGRISPASAVTDSFGKASTVYTAGIAPSAKDGVRITAAVGSVTDTVTLTVTQQPLFVVLGTAPVVINLSDTQYAKPYNVLVTDANGAPVAGATVSLSVIPTHYLKGFYVPALIITGAGTTVTAVCVFAQTGYSKFDTGTNTLSQPITGLTGREACQNEDISLNGLLDPGEDFNNNGRLDPGNVATVPTTLATNESGFAFFNIVYAKEFAGWVEVELEARAVVAGSEGTSQERLFLAPLASDLSNCTIAPPGLCSPYGVATTCTCDERTDPMCPITALPTPPQCLVLASRFTIAIGSTNLGRTTLQNTGGIFTLIVSGGSRTSYNLMTTVGTLSTLNVAFNQPFTLTLPANTTGAPLMITVTAIDVGTGQQGTLTLTQSPLF